MISNQYDIDRGTAKGGLAKVKQLSREWNSLPPMPSDGCTQRGAPASMQNKFNFVLCNHQGREKKQKPFCPWGLQDECCVKKEIFIPIREEMPLESVQ